ncbi:MAG TPA: hypothetical protein PL033_09700 [Candidatus Brocadiia bacterium]|nr:hypothetical protein [Candidatus Brocadiia bacterium]
MTTGTTETAQKRDSFVARPAQKWREVAVKLIAVALSLAYCLFVTPCAAADEQKDMTITLDSGKSYTRARLLRKEGDILVFVHSTGIAKVQWQLLSDESRAALGYTTREEEMARAKAKAEEEEAKAEADKAKAEAETKAKVEFAAEQRAKGLIEYKGRWFMPEQKLAAEQDEYVTFLIEGNASVSSYEIFQVVKGKGALCYFLSHEMVFTQTSQQWSHQQLVIERNGVFFLTDPNIEQEFEGTVYIDGKERGPMLSSIEQAIRIEEAIRTENIKVREQRKTPILIWAGTYTYSATPESHAQAGIETERTVPRYALSMDAAKRILKEQYPVPIAVREMERMRQYEIAKEAYRIREREQELKRKQEPERKQAGEVEELFPQTRHQRR